MAEADESPRTLANLWLKTSPSRPVPPIQGPASQPDETQLDLLFSNPAPAPESPSPSPRTRRSKRSSTGDPSAPSTAKPSPARKRSRLLPDNPGTSPPSAPRDRRIWTVHDLVSGIRTQLESSYADLWVEGEISNCKPAPSGHIYFTLKDGDAQLPVVLFRRQAQLLRFRPEDGLAILARGRISIYEGRGQLQLIAETLEPRGAGALQLAFEQLKARLLAEGLFEASRKRPLPAFPRTIGVVTSTSGAVLHDIIKVIRRRHARLNLLIYPALMQGPDCASTVSAGVRYFNRHPSHADLILIARGGGSLEDLAGFNDEGLARIIAASTLPVVSAVGHETDFTIADLVADLRAPTPSAAAELITAAQHRIEERVASLENRSLRAIRYQLILARQRLTTLSAPQVLIRVRDLIGRRHQSLDELHYRLSTTSARTLRLSSTRLAALTSRLERHNPTVRLALTRSRLHAARQALTRLAHQSISVRNTRLAHASARLRVLSPLAVLSRGYALVYTAEGALVRDFREVQPGQSIRARLHHGALQAEVTATTESE